MPCIRASDTSKAIRRGHTGANPRWIALTLPATRRYLALPAVLGLALVALPPLLPRALAQSGVTIPLPEPQGQTLLLQSADRADYGPLAEQFLTQANLAYCGVASMVMVLNSLAVPAPAATGYGSYRFWTQENVFEAATTRAVLSPEVVARQGMTLQELGALLASHGVQARAIHGDRLSLPQFRLLVRSNLSQSSDRLLVNYDRKALGQAGGGHISPLAAYNAATDRVLVLDVARYRYPSAWVPLADLWQAIRTTDSSSGRSRGVVVVRRI
ncbi:phytochelatin synthase family protein [Synechococcus sp. RedBA-s]|uniref:phytochelatin synthase family protein n=1 Tax=Synechococcus sp. RedBA-s TaxID=2823741 RepID=UPI0020CFB60C|nr:phytochelatin synthase family protein [Synechococcus sp. RedBA-s]MCP9800775.1 phytochelatin synthase family protein [Synechococcus sp. RedBA-s]